MTLLYCSTVLQYSSTGNNIVGWIKEGASGTTSYSIIIMFLLLVCVVLTLHIQQEYGTVVVVK